jgi:upstream activation factor subunit UAF30
MWEYIREHNLQNPKDKRQILLDEDLRKIFKVKSFTAFSMNKYLSQVIKNTDA